MSRTSTTTDTTTDHATDGADGAGKVALVTGGSSGLGRALVSRLADDGWQVITDGRDRDRLREATSGREGILAIPGDIAEPSHRAELTEAVHRLGRLDLLVNNASTLGPSPLPRLSADSSDLLHQVWQVNVAAPLALTTALLEQLMAHDGVVISISSDAAVEHYEGWGLYAASKAALDHLTLTLAEENPGLSAYAVDPGDMRTPMHQAAFPGEDISDRPLPEQVVPRIRTLLSERPPAGRYRAADLIVAEAVSA